MRYLQLIFLVSFVLLQACSTAPKKASTKNRPAGKIEESDGPPLVEQDISHIPDAIPKAEPKSRYGNPPTYKALGKNYKVMTKSKGYQAEGQASWYGRKFHGHRTSSGEPYDMFKMSAAHRSLPLPTYAKVKNLGNGKEIIVKINDRGPFAKGRIIDLSYAAAKKLGVYQTGVANVRVTAIDPNQWQRQHVHLAKNNKPFHMALNSPQKKSTLNDKQLFLQLGAFSQRLNAQQLANAANLMLAKQSKVNVLVATKNSGNPLYQVRIGPLANKEIAQQLEKKLLVLNKSNPPRIVYEPIS